MADRSLYDLLEVSPTASQEAIRASYERLAPKFDPNRPENATNIGANAQYDAVKEAFLTLGNAEKRKQYDTKLLRARSAIQYVEVAEPFWTLPKVVVLGIVVIAAAGFYYSNQKEKARLHRVEAEKQIATAKAKEAEENARVDLEKARSDAQLRRQEKLSEERAWRDRDIASQRHASEQRNQASIAERERLQTEATARRADNQRRVEESQAQNAARQQLAREKAELCRIERERYGKAISC